jgi:hypothetical protein
MIPKAHFRMKNMILTIFSLLSDQSYYECTFSTLL